MNRWMTRFALPGKCGFFGVSGETARLSGKGHGGGFAAEHFRQTQRGHAHAGPAQQFAASQHLGKKGLCHGSLLAVVERVVDQSTNASSFASSNT